MAIRRLTIIAVLVAAAAVMWQEPEAVEANGVVAIAAGALHTCAVTTSGGVRCWGTNGTGELGYGVPGSTSSVPGEVKGLPGSTLAVDGGLGHTCAVTTAGAAKCWGRNSHGALGDGATVDSTTPVDVSDLSSGVTAISTGGDSTCALTTEGRLKCWGDNANGQLGDGTDTGPELCYGIPCSTVPLDVAGLTSGVTSVAVGDSHACAVTADGGVKCWGRNASGELGNGTYQRSFTPVDAVGISSATAVSTGTYHTCALTAAGSVKCWGANFSGQLGNGTITDSSAPVDVIGLSNGVTAVSAGGEHTCALMQAGNVKCWGANGNGQMGNGTFAGPACGEECNPTPVDVTTLVGPTVSITTGQGHSCALTVDHGLKCWGRNDYGQMGVGTNAYSYATAMNVYALGNGPDSDGDGCPGDAEIALGPGMQKSGGNRDPKNPYDYFNPTHDGKNRLDDVLVVLFSYGVDLGNPEYDPGTDRTLAGPNAWNTGPPDGLQRVDDILNIVKQYFHDCG